MKAPDDDINSREAFASSQSLWRQAPSRGERPIESKLQMKEGHGRRAARQQSIPYQTQPTGAATETVTATLK